MVGLARPARRDKFDFSLSAINIVLLLLFFFIVTGTVTGKNEATVQPPLTVKLPHEKLPRPLLVLSSSGALFLNDVPVDRRALMAAVSARAAGIDKRHPVLNVIADRTLPAGPFLEIVNAIQRAGVEARIITLDSSAVAKTPKKAGESAR